LGSSLQRLRYENNMEKIGNKKNYPIPLDSLQDELEHAFVTQRANWYKELKLPERFSHYRFDTFKEELQPLAFRRSKEFCTLSLDVEGRAFVLCSQDYGIGKTHLLIAMVQELVGTKPPAIIKENIYKIPIVVRMPLFAYYITEPDLMSMIRDTFNPNSQERELEAYARLNRYPLLVIDDVGKIRARDGQSAFTQQVYYRLIEYRYSWQKSIALASNLVGADFEEYIGGASYSRLVEMSSAGKYNITIKGRILG